MREFHFHQTFTLDRDLLAALLRCVIETPTVSRKTISAAIGVNTPKGEGLQGWFCKTGLGTHEKQTYTISPFGELVARYDPYMEHPTTLWGLHYHLAANPHQERAAVWYSFFNTFAAPGKHFTSTPLHASMEQALGHLASSTRYITKDTNQLLNCYVRPEALGNLGLLRRSQKNMYEIEGQQPDPAIIAYVLFDSWQRLFPTTDTLRLTQLCEEPEMIGRVFVASRNQVRHAIGLLQGMGLLIFADTQHEPVTRRFHGNPLTFLEQTYQRL